MSRGVGALLVSLGLDASEYFAGLSKADVQAQRFAKGVQTNVASAIVKAEIALQALGATAKLTAQIFNGLTEGAAKFKDLEETTGAAAESIASFAVAGATAGVEIESIGTAMNKLTKNLVGVDDESKAAGAALKALGLNVKDFKELDPAAQYEAIGKALAGYADGSGKTAVAVALLGKAGAEQLKVFKALEEQGGPTTILTQKQIEQADEYADRQAKAAATVKLHAQSIAADALPALTAFTQTMIAAVAESTGLDTATGRLAASQAIKEWAFEQAAALAQLIGDMKALGLLAAATISSIDAANASASTWFETMKAFVTGSGEVADAMREQRIAVDAARQAWDAYNKFDPSSMARRIKFLGQIQTPATMQHFYRGEWGDGDARRGRGFVGKTGDDRPALRFNFGSSAADDAAAVLKKQLDATLRTIKESVESQKAAYDFAQQTVEAYYTDGLNSLTANIEAQKAIRAAGVSSLVSSLDAEISALEAYKAKATKPTDRLDADAKISDAQAKRTAAIVAGQRAESIATAQAVRDVRELERAYEDLFVNVLQLRGDEAGAAALRIARQVAEARRLIAQRGGGDELGDEFERRLKQAERLNASQREYSRLVAQASASEEAAILDAQERGDSEVDTLRRVGEVRQAALVQLQAMADAARRLAAESGTAESVRFAEELALQLKRATAEADPLLLKLRDVGREAGGTIAGAFEDAVLSGEKLSDVLDSLEKSLIRIAYQQLVTKPFENYLSGLIGGNGQASGGGGWIGALAGLFGGGGAGAGGGAAASVGGSYAGAILGSAIGGRVEAYGVREVAERRPEMLDVNGRKFLLMGNQRGTIDPMPELGGGGRSMSVTNNFHLSGPADRRTQGQIASEVARALAASGRDS